MIQSGAYTSVIRIIWIVGDKRIIGIIRVFKSIRVIRVISWDYTILAFTVRLKKVERTSLCQRMRSENVNCKSAITDFSRV